MKTRAMHMGQELSLLSGTQKLKRDSFTNLNFSLQIGLLLNGPSVQIFVDLKTVKRQCANINIRFYQIRSYHISKPLYVLLRSYLKRKPTVSPVKARERHEFHASFSCDEMRAGRTALTHNRHRILN